MSEAIHILMIDDDEDDFIIIENIVQEIDRDKYTLEWASSYESGLELIKKKKHSVYLVDYRLGAKTGIDLIKNALISGCEEPLILLTGQTEREIDHSALEVGAADYLVKGTLNAQTLENAIRYSIAHSDHIKEIKLLNSLLEERVAKRTSALEATITELKRTKLELNEALEKEKELNELKSRFVSMASHEFKTPLATILSSLSLIAKYGELNEPEKQQKHIERIKSGVNNLTAIINDVLSLSRLEEGGVTITPEEFDIAELVSETKKEIQSIARPKQTIRYQHGGNSQVFLDKKIIKNILLNLLSNAIKFSPEGKPILIKTKTFDSQLEIQVEDHGIGISDEDQKHLFERFFRAHNASNIQGTGLGLSILAKYVDMLQGNISFKSKLGEGTTFTMVLPNSLKSI